MNNGKGLLYAASAFLATAGLFFFLFRGGSAEHELKFHNPQKLEAPDGVAYTLDRVDGEAKDLTFRCNPTTGEGYFNLKSKTLSWASSHCQDMVGAVKDIEDKKKSHAIVRIKEANNQVFYQVQRNK